MSASSPNEKKPDRSGLLQKLVTLISADLATRDREELEGLLESIGSSKRDDAPPMLVSTNQAAMVFLHPHASKTACLEGLHQTAVWLEDNWEKVRQAHDARGIGAVPDPALPN